MKLRLKFKVIAASLALSVAGGQAVAENKSGDHDNLVPTAIIPGTVLTTKDTAITRESSPSKKTALERSAINMLVFYPVGSDISASKYRDTPGGKLGTKSSGGATLGLDHSAQTSPGFLLAANDADRLDNPVVASPPSNGKGLAVADFSHSANGQPSAMAAGAVPEPRNWVIVLAGLLGVGAIARRRMLS